MKLSPLVVFTVVIFCLAMTGCAESRRSVAMQALVGVEPDERSVLAFGTDPDGGFRCRSCIRMNIAYGLMDEYNPEDGDAFEICEQVRVWFPQIECSSGMTIEDLILEVVGSGIDCRHEVDHRQCYNLFE